MSAKNDKGGVWVNIYKTKDRDIYWTGSVGYSTKKIAEEGLCDYEHKIATVDIKKALAAYEENKRLRDLLTECVGLLYLIRTYDKANLGVAMLCGIHGTIEKVKKELRK